MITSTLEFFMPSSKNTTFTKESSEIRTDICSATNIVNKPSTPVPTAYRTMQSKVNQFNIKPSPVTAVTRQNTAIIKKIAISRIPTLGIQKIESGSKTYDIIKKPHVMKK